MRRSRSLYKQACRPLPTILHEFTLQSFEASAFPDECPPETGPLGKCLAASSEDRDSDAVPLCFHCQHLGLLPCLLLQHINKVSCPPLLLCAAFLQGSKYPVSQLVLGCDFRVICSCLHKMILKDGLLQEQCHGRGIYETSSFDMQRRKGK